MIWLIKLLVHHSIVSLSVKIRVLVLVDCQVLLLDLVEAQTSSVVRKLTLLLFLLHHHVHVFFTLYIDTVL